MTVGKVFACSHAGLLVTREGDAPSDQASTVRNAFVQMGHNWLNAGPTHSRHRHRPWSSLRLGARLTGPHRRAWAHRVAEGMGDAGVPEVTVPINQSVAQSLLSSLVGTRSTRPTPRP